jgi:hypothetical protein
MLGLYSPDPTEFSTPNLGVMVAFHEVLSDESSFPRYAYGARRLIWTSRQSAAGRASRCRSWMELRVIPLAILPVKSAEFDALPGLVCTRRICDSGRTDGEDPHRLYVLGVRWTPRYQSRSAEPNLLTAAFVALRGAFEPRNSGAIA